MAEKVVIKIKKVNGENVIRINQADKDVENKEVF